MDKEAAKQQILNCMNPMLHLNKDNMLLWMIKKDEKSLDTLRKYLDRVDAEIERYCNAIDDAKDAAAIEKVLTSVKMPRPERD